MWKGAEAAPLVSVIIPVYNCEEFLERCLDSVYAQTMQDFEVIAVNDGSTDRSLEILRSYEAKHANLRVIDQPNSGQGAARNRALGLARGEYVLFVDSDDFIESVTLQVTTERAEQDQSDLVHFDWKLYSSRPDRPGSHYYNADPFWHKRVLEGIECDELLRVQNFYSVSNLYRRTYLNECGIRFEEGRIYEDNPFVLQAVNRAQRISLVHSPLYVINPHPESTTRSNTRSDKHYRDHIYAVKRSFELLDRRNPRAATYLAAYHVKKMGPYYQSRIPRRYRRAYIREFVDIMHAARVVIPPNTAANAPTRLSARLRIFEKRRYLLFQAMTIGRNVGMPRYKKVRAYLRGLKHRNDRTSAWSAELESALQEELVPGTISFLGLDFRYAGNSRYLFEEIRKDPRFADCVIRFVTDDPQVGEEHRLLPDLAETYLALAQSEVVIAESWIPPRVRKHRDSTWLQLWHGTPIKRMLFDSHEPRIIWNRRHHKTAKYRDIQNWDYLLVDSEAAADKFETAFLFPKERMLRSGYPRVKYLLEHRDDARLRERIRAQLGLDRECPGKVVLYAPTWRDYNYGRGVEESDFEYVLDIEALAEELGEGYTVLFHDHGYLSTNVTVSAGRCVDAGGVEIQDLLLICDAVVTDYSSVAFDALAIETPVVLYTPDKDRFEESRGLYPDIWDDLQPFAVETLAEVARMVEENSNGAVSARLRQRYTYRSEEDLVARIPRLFRKSGS